MACSKAMDNQLRFLLCGDTCHMQYTGRFRTQIEDWTARPGLLKALQ